MIATRRMLATTAALALLLWQTAPARAQGFPVFDPRSPGAQEINWLSWLVIFFVVLIFVGTEAALIFAIIRYRHRGEAGEPRQIYGNRRVEIVWTTIPALILIAVFILSVQVMRSITVPSAQASTLTVQVTGNQWWWRFEYPDTGVVTANELHIPAGQLVRLELTSEDVIHDFWVPQLGRKMDVVPGQTNILYLSADEPGVYDGACAEYCGTQHAWMRIRVIAEQPDQFAAWVEQQRQPAIEPTTPVAARGRDLFLQSTANCAACHRIAGTPANGQVGPDLTHVATRQTLGSGVLPNTPEAMDRWVRDPHEVKPGVLMPATRLPEPDLEALLAYITSLQ